MKQARHLPFMTRPTYRYGPHPAVVYTKIDEHEAVLLHLETQRYFSLNETGVVIWELLAASPTLDEVAATLARTYETEQEVLVASVQRFLDELEHDGLVREVT